MTDPDEAWVDVEDVLRIARLIARGEITNDEARSVLSDVAVRPKRREGR